MLGRARNALLCAAALALLVAVGARAHAAAHARLTVYAASSLTDVLPKIDPAERYSFGGSNTLAAQIRQGAPADVFAAANTTLPAQLFAKGLCSKPVAFARNSVVVVVPRSNPAKIHRVRDLARAGVKVDIAGPDVPVGGYTLQVLKRMKLSASVLRNVVSRETDVRAVLAKVALAEADAGFVYSTDAKTVPGKVTVIEVPAWAQPRLEYGICLVSSSRNHVGGQDFVDRLLGNAGQAKLVAAGFLPRR